MHNPGMQNLGALIGTYGKSRSFLIVWWTLAALFAGAGALVLSLMANPNLRFDGPKSLLYAIGFGGLGLGIVIAAVAWLLVAAQPKFYLHENAIRAVGPRGDRTVLYADIEDLYLFWNGGAAYRTTPAASWEFFGNRIARSADLKKRLRSLHAQHRGERLYQELMAGRAVQFRCIPASLAQSKRFFTGRNSQDRLTFNMELTASALKVQNDAIDVRIDVQRIGDLNVNLYNERLQILDTGGKVFYETFHPAIMSLDALWALIERLQGRTGDPERVRNP